MEVKSLEIPEVKLITLKAFGDSRGFFVERFKQSIFKAQGLPTDFVQDNFSSSSRGVLRGLHFQWEKPQGKLVTCTQGEIFDVAVDIRKGSPHFGKSVSWILKGDKPQWLWIPAGFAHGFCVLSPMADLLYKCTAEYNPQCESGILWNDQELKIQWPLENPILSDRDTKMKGLREYSKNPQFIFGEKN